VAILAAVLNVNKEVFVKITLKETLLFIFILGGAFTPAWALVEVKGAGGVSEKPLAQSWILGDSAVKLKYESKNPADAVNQLLGKGCDFALITAPLTAVQTKKAASQHLLFLPAALSAQAVVYNLPGVPSGALKLTPAVLSDIFLGIIKKWDDPLLRKINPKLALPSIDIRVLHQSDESSMNDDFPSFLARQNPKWTFKREKDKNLHWPAGKNVNGNLKVYEKIRQWAGVIAVMNFSFAQEKGLPTAQIQNKSGRYVGPSNQGIVAAASEADLLPGDKIVVLTENRNKKAYPLSEIVWAVVHQDYAKLYHNHNKGQALADFLNWLLSPDGQAVISKDFYTPLPEKLLPQVQAKIQLIQY
jgi:phosphate transport system substrate-binding protein